MPARLTVACLLNHGMSRYKHVAHAMAAGIRACGDVAVIDDHRNALKADVAVMYGWKYRQSLKRYPQWLYADLGYWRRETHYRLSANDWSPQAYVRAGLPADRLAAMGVKIRPWNEQGREVLVLGASGKSMAQHGFSYLQWEMATARQLVAMGLRVVYRPKPNDPERQTLPIAGVGHDERPLADALQAASFVVAHHSNAAIDALVAGVPVHCVTGAAAAFSVPLEAAANPPRLEGREQFLADVAWLQWTLEEMRAGTTWRHLKDTGVIRC